MAGFFLLVFGDAWPVVIRPWSGLEAVEAPFSRTAVAETRVSVQSGRVPWAFGCAFHVVARLAAESRPAAVTLIRRLPSHLFAGRGLVAPVFGCGHPNKARGPLWITLATRAAGPLGN